MTDKIPSLVELLADNDLSSAGNRLFPVFLKLENLSMTTHSNGAVNVLVQIWLVLEVNIQIAGITITCMSPIASPMARLCQLTHGCLKTILTQQLQQQKIELCKR